MRAPNPLLFFFLALINLNSVLATPCGQPVCREALQNPCSANMTRTAPETFEIRFPTQYGNFTASCTRQNAPAWVDRLWNLATNGYYDSVYFYRVINRTNPKTGRVFGITQFGTNGNPEISKYYDSSNAACIENCGIIQPQPPYMAHRNLSNVFGTISFATQYNKTTETTWNVTDELFINTANNSFLDSQLYFPICNITAGMDVVTSFKSFGDIEELGGPGVNARRLTKEGNAYIAGNATFAGMAKSGVVEVMTKPNEVVTTKPNGAAGFRAIGGMSLIAVFFSLFMISL